MATQNKKYLDDVGLSAVAGYVKERLKTVTTMPVSANNGDVLLYTGTTSGSYTNGHIYQYNTTTSSWVDISDSSSITISPTPSSGVTESSVVSIINAALANNENVASLFGIQQWSNEKSKIFKYTGTVGSTGIGEWQDESIPLTAQDEEAWGWWYNDYFKSAEINSVNTDNLEIKFSFDNSTNEIITLGGYILDTDNGYLCVKFGNTIKNTANAKVFVEFIITRNSIN